MSADERKALLGEIKRHLRYQTDLGLAEVHAPTPSSVPPAPEVEETLEEANREASPGAQAQPTPRPTSDKAPRPPERKDAGEEEALRRLREDEVGDCRRCKLWEGRTNLVFGEGSPRAALVFVGEAPGFQEDRQGRPFVGRAGHLLTRMVKAIDLEREDVYICNVIKCRPPDNRDPQPDEVMTCEPFLKKQLEIIGPRIICAMGNFAVRTLLRRKEGVTKLRGRWFEYEGIPLMPTFHPAYVLRNPGFTRPLVWEDLQEIKRVYLDP